MKNKNLRDSIDREMSHIRWENHQQVFDALNKTPQRPARSRRSFMMVAAAALVLMTVTAWAMTLLFSPRYDAEKAARQALQETYGFSDKTLAIFSSQAEKTASGYTVTFESHGFCPEEVGIYTVTLDHQGKATETAWSLEGETDQTKAWTVQQLEEAIERRIVTQEAEIKEYARQNEENKKAGKPTPQPDSAFTQEERNLLQRAEQTMLENGFTKETLALFEPEVRKRRNEINVAWVADGDKVHPDLQYANGDNPNDPAIDRFGEYIVFSFPDDAWVDWKHQGDTDTPVTRKNLAQAAAFPREALPCVADFMAAYNALVKDLSEEERHTMFMSVELAAKHDQLFRDAGFKKEAYPAGLPRETDVQQDKALQMAQEAMKKELGVTEQMLKSGTMFIGYHLFDVWGDEDRPVWVFSHHLYGDNMQVEVPLEQQGIRTVVMYADSGEIIKVEFDPYYTGNG